jgi:hypothetical protein
MSEIKVYGKMCIGNGEILHHFIKGLEHLWVSVPMQGWGSPTDTEVQLYFLQTLEG